MHRYLILFFVLVGISACGGGGGSSTPKIGDGNPVNSPDEGNSPSKDFSANFPEKTLWGDAVSYTAFNASHKSEIASVAYGPDGQICYILKEAEVETETIFDYAWTSSLHCFDHQGHSIVDFHRTGKGIIKDVLFTPEGNILLADLIEVDPDDSDDNSFNLGFFLRFTLFSETGEILQQKLLTDTPSEEELYYYRVEESIVTREKMPSLTDDGKPVIVESTDFSMQWWDGSLYVMAYTYGIKTYRISENLNTVWGAQVMPAYTYLWTHLIQNGAALAVNEQGDVYVAFELFDDDILIYEHHFGRSLDAQDNPDDNASIGVSVFNNSGQYQRSFLAGVPEYSEQLVAIGFQNEWFWIGGNVRHDKFENADRTEWDLLLMRYSSADGTLFDYNLIHHDEGDFAYDVELLSNGNFLYGGVTGFRQAETNSIVSNGTGMLVEVTQEGEIARKQTMPEPRHVSINLIHAVNDNQILFANTYNGPITHTCDNDDSLCYQDAAVGVATLAE